MSKTHIIIASDDTVYYWHYRQKNMTILGAGQKKSGKENAFHIDEQPKTDGVYDKSSW